jgi:hypothetical protein
MRFLNLQSSLIALSVVLVGVTFVAYRYFGRYQPFADLINQSTTSSLGQIQLQVK